MPGAADPVRTRGYAARIAASISPYDPAERAALRAFQLEHFGATAPQADDRYFEWFFERNPDKGAHEPTLWVCKRDGVIVGQQAALPVTLKIGDVERRASWGVDLMVHPEWRLRGVGPALFAEFERSSDVLLGLGLSESVYRSCLRSGWTDMAKLPVIARPLDADACAEALGDRKWLARLAPNLLLGGSARVAAIAGRRLTGCTLERMHTFDERVDSVWAASKRDYPVLVKRDFRSLHWRFDAMPDGARYQRYYLTRRGELLGYAVIRIEAWRGHRAAYLVDYLCPRQWQLPLLSMVIDVARAGKAVAVFIEQLDALTRAALMGLGCLRLAGATRFIVKANALPAPHAAALGSPGQWFVTSADSDADLLFVNAAAQPPK